ncbi:MAG: S-layer homology domain-containing protein [Clostridia bacterium]|nr:S-layer homology domain-containing protein [Clostridia bacterium]
MKNFKKVLSLILACAMVLGTFSVVSADISFKDMTSSHWGWTYVQTLVGDGTINGYTDGTFRPEANVTRAEFVKMIGKTNKSFDKAFDDITGHWAYDYIMYSDMDVNGSIFYPDVAITRNDVINLLWKRAGSPNAVAPSVITRQSTKAGAAAWAYSYGIMNGDDGVNLRLSDGVTRAEAAALICRSRAINTGSAKKVFAETVNEKILKEIYESFNLFGDEYNPDRTFTNGELVGAVMRLAYDATTPMYERLGTKYSVDRPNTLAFYTACKYVLGEDRMNVKFYDATAKNLDAIALMSFAAVFNIDHFSTDHAKNDFYADVTSIKNDNLNEYVTCAYKNGIRLDNNNNIYPDKAFTAKEFALVLLQLDSFGGFNSKYEVGTDTVTNKDVAVKTEILNYPNSADKYMYVAAEVPNSVMDSAYIDENGKVSNNLPKDSFKLARDHSKVFTFTLNTIVTAISTYGADVSIVYYPSMVVKSDKGYVMKVLITVNDFENGKTFDDVFPNEINGKKPDLKQGLKFYATFATGSELAGMYIPVDKATFTSIDYIY